MNVQHNYQIKFTINQYNVFNYILGKGNYGEVYLAYDTIKNQIIAVKKIDKRQEFIRNRINDANSNKELRGAQTQQQLKLNGIVQIFEVLDTDDFLFIFQEYCNGNNLRNLQCKCQGTLKENEVQEILFKLEDCFMGMFKCYPKSVIHRDIKPENILIHNNEFKLGDFDLARFIDYSPKEYDAKLTKIGTVRYCSLECLSSLYGDLNANCDVFSLGMTIYDLIFGQSYYPFNWCYDKKQKQQQVYVLQQNLGAEQIKELMVEKKPLAQKWRENHSYPFIFYPKQISNELQDLLNNMLQIESQFRFHMDDVYNHKFITTYKKIYYLNELNLQQLSQPNFENNTQELEFVMAEIKLYLNQNLYKNVPKMMILSNLLQNVNEIQQEQIQQLESQMQSQSKINYDQFQQEEIQNLCKGIHQFNMFVRNNAILYLYSSLLLFEENFRENHKYIKLNLSYEQFVIIIYLLILNCNLQLKRHKEDRLRLCGNQVMQGYKKKNNQLEGQLSDQQIMEFYSTTQIFIEDLQMFQDGVNITNRLLIFLKKIPFLQNKITNLIQYYSNKYKKNYTDIEKDKKIALEIYSRQIKKIFKEKKPYYLIYGKNTLILIKLLQIAVQTQHKQHKQFFQFAIDLMNQYNQEKNFQEFYEHLEKISIYDLLDNVVSWPQYPLLRKK